MNREQLEAIADDVLSAAHFTALSQPHFKPNEGMQPPQLETLEYVKEFSRRFIHRLTDCQETSQDGRCSHHWEPIEP